MFDNITPLQLVNQSYCKSCQLYSFKSRWVYRSKIVRYTGKHGIRGHILCRGRVLTIRIEDGGFLPHRVREILQVGLARVSYQSLNSAPLMLFCMI